MTDHRDHRDFDARFGQHPGADNHGGRGPKPEVCGTVAGGTHPGHPALFGEEAQAHLGFVDGAMHRAAERELPIVARGALEQGVDARKLHAWLGVGRDFSNWVKGQIGHCRLVEHRDFEVFAESGENPSGGRPRVQYLLSLDAAKHVAMASNTEQGFFAREYFIAAERRLREIAKNEPPRPIRQTPRPSAAREREARLAAKEERLRSSAEARERAGRAKVLLEVASEMRQVGAVGSAKSVLDNIARSLGVEVP